MVAWREWEGGNHYDQDERKGSGALCIRDVVQAVLQLTQYSGETPDRLAAPNVYGRTPRGSPINEQRPCPGKRRG